MNKKSIIRYEISGKGLLAYWEAGEFYHIHSNELTKLEKWINEMLDNQTIHPDKDFVSRFLYVRDISILKEKIAELKKQDVSVEEILRIMDENMDISSLATAKAIHERVYGESK